SVLIIAYALCASAYFRPPLPAAAPSSPLSLHAALPICSGGDVRPGHADAGGQADHGTGGDDGLRAVGVVQGFTALDVGGVEALEDRKSTRLNSSHVSISYAGVCLQKTRRTRTDGRRTRW